MTCSPRSHVRHLLSFGGGALAVCGAEDATDLTDRADRVTCPACLRLLKPSKARA